MTPRSFALACVLPLLTIAAVTPSNAPRPPARAATVCTCADVIELINRMNMAQSAVDALTDEVAKIQGEQRSAGKEFLMDERTPSGNTYYERARAGILAAMASVQMEGVKSASGKTDADCKATIEKSATPCLDEVVMAHEQDVHVHACSTEHKAGAFTLLGKRPVQTARAYAEEEIRGYKREIEKIAEILKGLPPECQSAWVGHIYFYEKKSMATTITMGPQNTRVSSTQTSKTDFSRSATILFRSTGASLLNHSAGNIGEMSSTNVARTYCSGGLAGPVGPQHTITTTSSTKGEVAVKTEGDADAMFNFDPETGNFSVSISVPNSEGTGTSTSSITVSGSCNPADDGTKGGTASIGPEPFAGASAIADGTASRTALQIRGSKSFDWAPPVSVPGVTHTHTARLEWIIYRIQ